MTDTQEQTLPGSDASDGVAPQRKSAGAAGRSGASRPATKRASLSTMLLPELQQIAGGLGISTAKKKKSDLVAAIQAARASSTPTLGDAPTGTTTAGTAPSKSNGAASRRSAGSAAAAPAAESTAPAAAPLAAPDADGAAPAGAGRRRNRGEHPRDTDADARQDENRPASADRQSTDESRRDNQSNPGNESRPNTQQNGSRQNTAQHYNEGSRQNGTSQNGTSQSGTGQSGTGQNGSGQNGSGQNGSGQNGSSQNGAGQNDDDDFEGGGRRRGRRYRDRRGRNRERQGGTDTRTGTAESEPMVSEDDVLVPVAGVVDCIEEKNNWFVRVGGYFATPEDVFIGNTIVRRYGLRRGDAVTGAVRQPRDGERREKYNPLVRLDTVNGREPDAARTRPEFTKLTPLYPNERLRLETEPHILTTRVIDLVMPIGKGQRALIVSPPKAGKTMVLQSIANAIAVNNPEAHLMVVLVDERPEEVTDMQRSVKGEVIASTFDRRPQDHITVAELSIERAKRLVEMGHDVVVLLDSITRLGRAYNLGAPASGRILSGGVDSQALYQPKRFLGAARNIENGGSLTIIATALVETGSAGDTVFFEEYKGTGNAELKLDRKIADKRVFPAIDVDQSSTRKEEILLSPDELAVTIKLRRVLHALESQQAIELLLDRLRKTRTNIEFLMNIAKTTPGNE